MIRLLRRFPPIREKTGLENLPIHSLIQAECFWTTYEQISKTSFGTVGEQGHHLWRSRIAPCL